MSKDHGWLREHLCNRFKLVVTVVTESILLLVILLCVWAIAGIEKRLFTHDYQLEPCQEVKAPSEPELRRRSVGQND